VRLLAEALGLNEEERDTLIAALRSMPMGADARESLRESPTGRAPSVSVVPRQLPADVAGFTGRVAHLYRLDRLLLTGVQDTATAVVISAIAGTAGVGKSALAVHWAHRVAGRFPDGQLYVNLRGFDSGGRAMSPAQAVRGFLDALEVSPHRIPADLEAQVGLYRSMIAGKRILVVLDNARNAEQVRPLLPGTPTALVVVTSRDQLTSLIAAQGAYPVNLDVLSTAEARQLLARRLGASRAMAEPAAVDQIISACARLPLALAIAAARAQRADLPLAALASELSDAHDRLDALDAGEIGSQVRAVFSWSYTALSPPAARLFRLLSLHPGPDFSVPAAASMTGHPLPHAHRLLTELARVSMLVEHIPGRYSCHDLLRAYATELSHREESEDQRRTAITRLLDHYSQTADMADRLLDPHRSPVPLPLATPVGASPEHLADHIQAMAWLTTEHAVLLACLRHAQRAGYDTQTWQLARGLDTFLGRQGYWHDQASAWQAALPAAARLGVPAGQAVAHRQVARAFLRFGRYPEAHGHYLEALELYSRAEDRIGQANTELGIAYICEREGRPHQALDRAQRALTLYTSAQHRQGQARSLNALGWYHSSLGDHAQALTFCQRGLAILQQLGDRPGEAVTWDSLGYAYHHLGRQDEAADCYAQALALCRDLGDRYYETIVLTHLGEISESANDLDAARSEWEEALNILIDLDHPDAERVHVKIRNLDAQRR
jgi:tetratricopeptide (TPR) repeat protein